MRGRSSDKGREAQLRQIMDAESIPGRVHLAGIAISFATGMSELTARRYVERVLHLRHPDVGVRDPEILIMLNPPRNGGQS